MGAVAGRIIWDDVGDKYYESGVSQCVLYTPNSSGEYVNGEPWNGVISIQESPSGGEPNDMWADNQKYASLLSAEEFSATIEAYTYPDTFATLDGTAVLTQGVRIGQQTRGVFGLCYKTNIGNDLDGQNAAFLLHILYGCKASPSDKSYETENDSPDALTFSWELNTTPVPVSGYKSTASVTIDSRTADEDKLAALIDILYGKDASGGEEAVMARLPLPNELKTLMTPVVTP